MKRSGAGRISVITVSWRTLVYRFFVLFMLSVSASFLVISRTHPQYITQLRTSLMDIVVPVVQTVAAPVDAFQGAMQWMHDVANVKAENERLRQENAKLMRWQFVATEMENENTRLRDLLKFAPVGKESYTSARVAIDNSGPYVKSVIINAGAANGVESDLAVINENGLVGRVMDAGARTARVLLLTDMNSRVPVMTEKSRERAIVAGDNSDTLQMKYLPQDSKISVGERVVTTSDGGVLPPGLPVGVVTAIENGSITVKPYVDWFRLEYVSVVDFTM
jgi:rod shape-determining protein MreC